MVLDVSRPLRPPLAARANVAIIALGFVAPPSAFVAFRLLIKSCTGINFLVLPWPGPVEVIVAVLAIALALAWFPSIVWGYLRPELRIAAVASTCTALLLAGPVLVAVFLSIYGDPGVNCVPI